MDYIKNNKEAWEEAFDHRKTEWGEKTHLSLKESPLYYFNGDMKKELKEIDFKGKTIAQFCCNNGRELLSLMDLGASSGIGFDIAENILQQARETALKARISNCEFVACDILEIPLQYQNQFDFIFLQSEPLHGFKI